MAKTIKFNLNCNGKSIRTIEDLRNNFCVEDVLPIYRNGLLQRWLEVRGYQKELDAVNQIDESEDDKAVVKNLIKIIGVEADDAKIDVALYFMDFAAQKEQDRKSLEAADGKETELISKYDASYERLIENIICSKSAEVIKQAIEVMITQYRLAFDRDYRRVFELTYQHNMLALMCFLMNAKTREYILSEGATELSYSQSTSEEYDKFNKTYLKDEGHLMHDKVRVLTASRPSLDFVKALGDNVKFYSDATDQYWKDLESKGTKVMVLYMSYNSKCRGAGDRGGELTNVTVNGIYPILDGLDFMNATGEIYWMEV